jgi:ketol-acid reductoisomerase
LLKEAETMITTALNSDSEYKQLLQDLQLLFVVWMMNPKTSKFDAYSSISREVNNLNVNEFIKNKIRQKLRAMAKAMVETQERSLAYQLFKDVEAPHVKLNQERVEEVRANLKGVEEYLAQKLEALARNTESFLAK